MEIGYKPIIGYNEVNITAGIPIIGSHITTTNIITPNLFIIKIHRNLKIYI